MSYSIRKSCENDSAKITEIIESAKDFLRLQGLPQWQNGYPNLSTIQNDIVRQQSYVLLDDGVLAGTFCLCFGEEPSYNEIYNGAWLSSFGYATIHRVAVNPLFRGQGIASLLLQQATQLVLEEKVCSIRVDTHPGNIPMQKLLQKNGFILCGTIYLSAQKHPNDERIAYEKVLF